jgi:hypothetical protein
MGEKRETDQGKLLPTPQEWAAMTDTLVTLTKRVTGPSLPSPRPSGSPPPEPR